jgi:hypothetical protein
MTAFQGLQSSKPGRLLNVMFGCPTFTRSHANGTATAPAWIVPVSQAARAMARDAAR